MYNKDLAIVIPSCDEYVDVVDECLRYFHLNWSDCPFRILLITQSNLYDKDPTISSYTTFENAKWADRMKKALEETNCRYILNMMEDAFISDRVSNQYTLNIIKYMQKNNINYYSASHFKLRYTKDAIVADFPDAVRIKRKAAYGINCLAEIWDRNELLRLINNGIKTGWDIERYFLAKSKVNDSGYYTGYLKDRNNWLNIVHSIYGGKWTYDIKILEDKGFPVNIGDRPMMSLKEYRRGKIHHWCNQHLPPFVRAFIKKVMSRTGYKFRTME